MIRDRPRFKKINQKQTPSDNYGICVEGNMEEALAKRRILLASDLGEGLSGVERKLGGRLRDPELWVSGSDLVPSTIPFEIAWKVQYRFSPEAAAGQEPNQDEAAPLLETVEHS
ncbi:hypothetical protein VTK26DRAFT_540 [Humicola hyalothermophila]